VDLDLPDPDDAPSIFGHQKAAPMEVARVDAGRTDHRFDLVLVAFNGWPNRS
jgi:hypothetical protein